MKNFLKKVIYIMMFAIGLVLIKSSAAYAANIVYTDKEIYKPGETITVTYSLDSANILSGSAWIGIVPSNIAHGSEYTNDCYDLAYRYVSGRYGTVTFSAPYNLGTFDFRLNDNDSSGREVAASSVFKISNENTISVSSVSLNRTKLSVKIGESKNLLVNILPQNATNKSVLWSSSNPSVVSVNSNGEVTGVSRGEADIVCTTINGRKTAVCHMYVTQAGSILSIESNRKEVNAGDTVKMQVSLDNIDESIKSEDIYVGYDSTKLKFEGFESTSGVRILKCKNEGNKIHLVCSNKSITSGRNIIFNLNFKTLKSGSALVNLDSADISTKLNRVRALGESELGEEVIFTK